MALTLLVAGDLHLGRASSRAPASVPAERLHSRAAWEAVVAAAIGHGVDLLLLTGDVIDASNRHWEAIGPIVRGVERLRAAGIRTVAVAGNHDFDALPRAAAAIGDLETFRLLGAGGTWERMVVERGGERLALDGWSFPGERVTADPVDSYPLRREPGVTTVGLVHGDLDSPASPYAPLRRARLIECGIDAWLLGHVHAPSSRMLGGCRILYTGSTQALDFGEPGPHGAWRIEVRDGRVGAPSPVPLSSVRYETLVVRLGEGSSAETDSAAAEVETQVHGALRDLERRCAAESGRPLAGLSVRVRLIGCSAESGALCERLAGLSDYSGAGELAVRIDDVRDETLPAVDLARLAEGGGSPLAVAARALLELDRSFVGAPGAAFEDAQVSRLTSGLLRSAAEALASVARRPEYEGCIEPDDDVGSHRVPDGGPAAQPDDEPGHKQDGEPSAALAPAAREVTLLRIALRSVVASLLRQEPAT